MATLDDINVQRQQALDILKDQITALEKHLGENNLTEDDTNSSNDALDALQRKKADLDAQNYMGELNSPQIATDLAAITNATNQMKRIAAMLGTAAKIIANLAAILGAADKVIAALK